MTHTKLATLALAIAFVPAVPGPIALAAEFSPEATALPFPPDARDLEIAARFGDIRYTSQSPLKSLAAFYLKEMAARGWEHDESAAELENESIKLTFKHGKEEAKIEFKQGSKEVKVSLDTEGLKFSGADDPAKLAAAGLPVPRAALFLQKELPPPAGVQGLDYAGNRAIFKSPMTLAESYDHYTKAVLGKGFRESRKPILSDSRRYSEFKKGTLEVSVNVFTDPVGSRVVLEYKDEAKEPAKPPLAAVATLPIKNAKIDKTTPATPAGGTPGTPAGGTPIDVAKNKGSAVVSYAGKQYTFPHVACYQTKRDAAPTLVFSAKPIPVNKMQTLIATKDDFRFGDLYENSIPERLILQLGNNLSFTMGLQNVYVGNSVDNPVNELKIAEGRVQGTLKMPPREAFKGEQLSFAVTADAVIMTPSTRISGPADLVETSTLGGDSPVPFPPKTENVSREGSKFRKTHSALVAMPLEEVTEFYKKALAEKGWKAVEPAAAGAAQFKTDTMELSLTLKTQGDKTAIQAVTRDQALAKAEGVLPDAGKTRLVLANAHTAGVVYSIGKTDYPLKPEQGAKDLKQALNYSIAPGAYTIVIKIPGQPPQTAQIEMTADTAWAIIAIPTGSYLSMRLY